MWKMHKMWQGLGPIEEEEEALEEERVSAGNVPPVPMLYTKARMVQLRKARIPRANRSDLEQFPPRMPAQRRRFRQKWLMPTCKTRMQQIKNTELLIGELYLLLLSKNSAETSRPSSLFTQFTQCSSLPPK